MFIHTSVQIAIGARVMITNNVHIERGVCNGATGVVVGVLFHHHDPAEIMTVLVRLDHNNEIVRVTRSKFDVLYRDNSVYWKSTFPMTLGYAMTGMNVGYLHM